MSRLNLTTKFQYNPAKRKIQRYCSAEYFPRNHGYTERKKDEISGQTSTWHRIRFLLACGTFFRPEIEKNVKLSQKTFLYCPQTFLGLGCFGAS